MNPYKTTHTFVTPQGTYTTTLEFTPAAESAPEVSPIKDDLIDAAIANVYLSPPLTPKETMLVSLAARSSYCEQEGTPAIKASRAVERAVFDLRFAPR